MRNRAGFKPAQRGTEEVFACSIILPRIYLAGTDCRLGCVSAEDHRRLRQNIEARQFNRDIDFFLSLPAFVRWSRTAIRKVVAEVRVVAFRKGEVVCSPQVVPQYVYVVKNGEFDVLATQTLKRAREPALNALLGPPVERELRRQRNARSPSNRRSVDLNYTVEKSTFHV